MVVDNFFADPKAEAVSGYTLCGEEGVEELLRMSAGSCRYLVMTTPASPLFQFVPKRVRRIKRPFSALMASRALLTRLLMT